jgi:hypothetical protein
MSKSNVFIVFSYKLIRGDLMLNQIILGIHVPEREKQAIEVQKIISEFGCYVRARIGLHDVGDKTCSPIGMIILQMACAEKVCTSMVSKLKKIKGVKAKKMVF